VISWARAEQQKPRPRSRPPLCTPLELGDTPRLSPATSPVALGTGGCGEDTAVGKEGAAGASWSACHVAADGTGTKRLTLHGSRLGEFFRRGPDQETAPLAMGTIESSIAHSPWGAPEGTPAPQGSGKGGFFPSNSCSGMAFSLCQSPPHPISLACKWQRRPKSSLEQRCQGPGRGGWKEGSFKAPLA